MSSDPNRLVELAACHTEMEAQLLVARLSEEGIDAVIYATGSAGLGFMSTATFRHAGAQVRVRASDEERAQAILEAFLAERPEEAEGDEAVPEEE